MRTYRIVEASRARWWRRATYYIESEYGRLGPMTKRDAKQFLGMYHFLEDSPFIDPHALRTDITVRSRTESEQNAGETGYKHE